MMIINDRFAILRFSLIILGSVLFSTWVAAQSDIKEIDSIPDIAEPLQRFSTWGTYNEYKVLSKESSLYELRFTLSPAIAEHFSFNIEVPFQYTFDDTIQQFTPGDIDLRANARFFSKRYHQPGYQGLVVSLMLTIPTGKEQFLSGYNEWILVPGFTTSFRFKRKEYSIGGQVRLYKTMDKIGTESVMRGDYGRFNLFSVYETRKFWVQLETETRYIFKTGKLADWLMIESGYKFSKRFGLFIKGSKRVTGSGFYNYFVQINCYLLF